jgi:glycosyltransferase involved in cell wall biosynthesis
MEYIAIQRPQWKLTLVGPQHPDGILSRTGLLSLPNVEYRGPMPQKDVPTFLRSLDVCLMPHRDTEYSRSMGPLKLYQYLASGKPVVSTAVAGLDQVREHVRVASDYDEFVRHIEEALQTDNPTLAAKRIDAARKQTWRLRIREIFDVVRSHLDQHSPATTKSSLPDNRHPAP